MNKNRHLIGHLISVAVDAVCRLASPPEQDYNAPKEAKQSASFAAGPWSISMNFDHLDILVYSSHKTATQTLLGTFRANNISSRHLHELADARLLFPSMQDLPYDDYRREFMRSLEQYRSANGKTLTILSVVRNPADRLISSFFQRYDSDEIDFEGIPSNLTTVQVSSVTRLAQIFLEEIQGDKIAGGVESIDEMSDVFDVKIISQLERRDEYYFFENDVCRLYALDFNKVISNDKLLYLNKVCGLDLIVEENVNVSRSKSYCQKYVSFRQCLPNVEDIIRNRYHEFYFTAFS